MFETLTFYVLLFSIVTLITKRNKGIQFVLFWWGGLNVLSYFSISGLFLISKETQYIYFLFFFFFTISFIFTEKLLDCKNFKKSNISYTKSFYLFLYKLGLFVVLPIQLIFTFRAIYLLSFVMVPAYYRNDVFGLITGTSSLFFNSITIAKLHAFLIGPMQFVLFFAGFSYFLNRKKRGLLVLGIVLIILDAFMMFGRFGYHYLILSLILYFLFKGALKENLLNWKLLLRSILLFFVLLVIVFKITNNRGDSNVSKILKTFVITYHTESFPIFDTELRNPNSILHDFTYGRSTFGGLERYIVPVFNQFGYHLVSQADEVGGYLHQNFLIGYDEHLRPLLFNAYGSIFFTMYRDGGKISISIFGILFGVLLSLYSGSFKTKDPIDFAIFYGLLFILIYGVFQPTVLGPMLPSILLLYMLRLILSGYFKLLH